MQNYKNDWLEHVSKGDMGTIVVQLSRMGDSWDGKPGELIDHAHTVFHFSAYEKALDEIAISML